MDIRFSRLLLLVFFISANTDALAVTSTPIPQSPANGTVNWLYNNGGHFTWQQIPGATYRIVVSDKFDFSNFSEASLSCTDPGCVTFTTTNSFATRANLANFWFYGTARYYWRVRASTATGGTSAWSGAQWFEPSSSGLKLVLTTALPFVGGASPQSVTGSWLPVNDRWLTDMAGGDGSRYRTAMGSLKVYVDTYPGGFSSWVTAGRPISTTVRNTMTTALTAAPSRYPASIANQIVDQMRAVFAGVVPTNDDDMLLLMRIRAQCKEFADRMVIQAGLYRKPYTSIGSTAFPRPGMYAFKTSLDHAGIVRAVLYNTNGSATILMLESNYGTGWENPTGSVPWLRVVRGDRSQALGTSYVVVDPSI